MPVLSETDFDKMAAQVMHDYFSGGQPLNDGIVKVAEEAHLTPDQIRQLVCVTNVKTHLELFDKQAEHKIIEFPVADPFVIMQKFYGDPEQLKVASTSESSEIDFYSDLPRPADETTLPVWPGSDNLPKTEGYKTASTMYAKNVLTLRKTAEELHNKMLDSREVYIEKISQMVGELRKYNADPYSLLADVRTYLTMDKTACAGPIIATAGEAARLDLAKIPLGNAAVIDTDAPIFKFAAEASKSFDACVIFAKAEKTINEKLAAKGVR